MVAAITMVKDEADIVERTVGRMVEQVDVVIVADNGSTDGTREILDGLGCFVRDDPEVAYYQSFKMSQLAEQAREVGADWIIPFDADEWWMTEGRLATALDQLPPEVLVVEAHLLDHVATGHDPDTPDPIKRMGWRRTAAASLRKVAFRAVQGMAIHQGNHAVDIPGVPHPPTVTNLLEVRHFPYRSPEQMVRKAVNGGKAYAATNLPDHEGAHWRDYGRIVEERGEEALHDVFREWFWVRSPRRDPGVTFDPAR